MGNDISCAPVEAVLNCDQYCKLAEYFVLAQIRLLQSLDVYGAVLPISTAYIRGDYIILVDYIRAHDWQACSDLLAGLQDTIDILCVFDAGDVVSRTLAKGIRVGFNSLKQNVLDILRKSCAKRVSDKLHPDCEYCNHFQGPVVDTHSFNLHSPQGAEPFVEPHYEPLNRLQEEARLRRITHIKHVENESLRKGRVILPIGRISNIAPDTPSQRVPLNCGTKPKGTTRYGITSFQPDERIDFDINLQEKHDDPDPSDYDSNFNDNLPGSSH